MKTALISILFTFVFFVVLVNMPIKYVSLNYWFPSKTLGATLTTISSGDQISAFPAVHNANMSELNLRKPDLADLYSTTTSQFAWTTLSSLATVGTITSGTWNGSGITVAYGGTGSSTLTANMVLLGNGTGAIKSTPVQGSNGQFLGMSGGVPTWLSTSVDTTANYTWTGLHTFSATSTFATTTFGGISLAPFSSSVVATGTVAMVGQVTNGVVNLNYRGVCMLIDVATTSPAEVTGTTNETSLFGTYVPADIMGTTSVLTFRGNLFANIAASANTTFRVYVGTSNTYSQVIPMSNAGAVAGGIQTRVIATTSEAAQETNFLGTLSPQINDSDATGFPDISYLYATSTVSTYSTVNSRSPVQFRITAQLANGSNKVQILGGELMLCKK